MAGVIPDIKVSHESMAALVRQVEAAKSLTHTVAYRHGVFVPAEDRASFGNLTPAHNDSLRSLILLRDAGGQIGALVWRGSSIIAGVITPEKDDKGRFIVRRMVCGNDLYTCEATGTVLAHIGQKDGKPSLIFGQPSNPVRREAVVTTAASGLSFDLDGATPQPI